MFNRGDIVSWPAPDEAGVDEVQEYGLVEDVRGGLIDVWCPFRVGEGPARREMERQVLQWESRVRLLSAARARYEYFGVGYEAVLPALAALDAARRLRVVFLVWYFDKGPGARQGVDEETMLFLSEL